MAVLPENIGVPTTVPDAQPPDDYQHLDVNANQFGGHIAAGAEALGTGLSKATQFFGEVQTDDAINTAMTTVNQHLNAYRALNGAEALRAQQPTQDAIDQAFEQGKKGLSSPQQRYQYDQTVRTFQQRYVSGIMASHADQQAKEYATQVNQKALLTTLDNVTNVADDPAQVEMLRHDARAAAVKQVHLEGNDSDPSIVQGAIERADAAVYKTQIEAIAVKDPARAAALAEDKKKELGTAYAPLAEQLRTRSLAVSASREADALFAPSASGAPVTSTITGDVMLSALHGQESGGAANAPTSVDGAVGPMQIKPGTFAQFAKPGESVTNPADNLAVGKRIVDTYTAKYNGDPGRVAVAYFSGEGNVAPPGSPTPYLHDAVDGNGKPVSSYVADVNARLVKAGLKMDQAQALAQVGEKYRDNPQMAAMVRSQISERFSILNMAQQAQAQKQISDVSEASDTWLTKLYDASKKDPTSLPALTDQLMHDPALHSNPAQRESLRNIAEKLSKGDETNPGPGYYDTLRKVNTGANGEMPEITDPSQLINLAAQGYINEPQRRYLAATMQKVAKGDDDAKIEQSRLSKIQAVRGKMVFEQDVGPIHIPDPEGAYIFDNQFIPLYNKAFDDWTEHQHKPAWEFILGDTADKLAEQLRPQAKVNADRVAAQATAVGENPALAGQIATQPVPAAPAGINRDEWDETLKNGPTVNGAPMLPQLWAPIVNSLLANPTPERLAAFDASPIGKAGIKAEDLIKRLHKAKEPRPFFIPDINDAEATLP